MSVFDDVTRHARLSGKPACPNVAHIFSRTRHAACSGGASRARRTGACASTPRRGSPTGWAPTGCVTKSRPPSAVVLWSHGLHEHLGRFEKLHEALVAKNVAVYAWDHVGHGESGSCGEKRHQFPRGFDAVVADALQFARCETRQTRGTRKTKRAHPTRGFVSSRASRFFHIISSLSDLRPPRASRARHAGWCAPSTRRTPRFPFSSVA